MRFVVIGVAVVALVGCSSDDGGDPAPGGINGPARVVPNSGADNPDADE